MRDRNGNWISFMDVHRKLGRWWGLKHGYKGNQGGWIFREGRNRPVCQGWLALYHRNRMEIWDWINNREVK